MSFVDYFRYPSKSTDKHLKYRIEYLKKKKSDIMDKINRLLDVVVYYLLFRK